MARAKIKTTAPTEQYKPPPIEFYFYIGSKYYYRLQPIPYKYQNNYVKKLKEILLANK